MSFCSKDYALKLILQIYSHVVLLQFVFPNVEALFRLNLLTYKLVNSRLIYKRHWPLNEAEMTGYWIPLRIGNDATIVVVINTKFLFGLLKKCPSCFEQLVHDALRERMLTGNDRIKVDALKKVSFTGHDKDAWFWINDVFF